jgi:hypothetical protein
VSVSRAPRLAAAGARTLPTLGEPGGDCERRGPGHNAVLGDLFVHHFYDDDADAGIPELQVRPLRWSEDGWPVVGE